jgi:hypothetical protein
MMFTEFSKPIEHNTVLNPKIWDHDTLKGPIKGSLLGTVKDFIKFLDVPLTVVDVVITGGNANYTYTSSSDIDLHIVADLSNVPCDREIHELIDAKRRLYKRKYDISAYGIPVEVYVEDLDHSDLVSAGCYSILRDQWLKQPVKNTGYDEKAVKAMVKTWKTLLKGAISTGSLQACRNAVQLLKSYRTQGLKTDQGEFSIPNLVYKSLRNDLTLEGILTFIDQLHSQELSLK